VGGYAKAIKKVEQDIADMVKKVKELSGASRCLPPSLPLSLSFLIPSSFLRC
jgi:hypothetical protein